jgi:GT2 family glycosyltransferase
MPADLSVVICSLNGAAGVDRSLRALAQQSIRPRMEIIVVDDGSTDDTAEVARGHGVTVISHPYNRGLAAARNTGLNGACADIVAYLDDDCEPEPDWAAQLLTGYDDENVAGVGGEVVPNTPPGYLRGFLARNNPLKPLEQELAESNSLPYRFRLYLRRVWSRQPKTGRRDVYGFAGANMSFRRKALFDAGQFDERFSFGGEDVDMCWRVRETISSARLVFVPSARAAHHFKPELRDTLRRSRAYGVGSGRLYRKWPSLLPALFPGPLLVLLALVATVWVPALAIAAAVAPLALYPRGLRSAAADREPAALLDGYVQLAQETMESLGFIQGYWRYRRLVPHTPIGLAERISQEQPL